MISFLNSKLVDYLPKIIGNDPRVKALSYAEGNQISKIIRDAEKLKIYCKVDSLDDYMLDIICLELDVPQYKTSYALEQKKELAKNALSFRAKAGTVDAVENICRTIFGDATVVEWFDYGASPGMFKISTMNPKISAGNIDEFKKVAESVKRQSQHLEIIELMLSMYQDVYFGGIARIATTETLICKCN